MLLGSMIGDALGGPVEFVEPDRVSEGQSVFRVWGPSDRLPHDIDAYADATRLLDYTIFRPEPEPYAHWEHDAPAGTLTDDTRQKAIVIRMLRDWRVGRADGPPSQTHLARALLDIANDPLPGGETHRLSEEWLREYVLAARYVLGERDPTLALPPQRIWGGLPTCVGQMMLPPLAGLFPGRPKDAYVLAHDIAFADNGVALDINAGFIAGLAAAMALDAGAPEDRSARVRAWDAIKASMLETDPFRYADVPWVERPLARCIKLAEELASSADGRPKQLMTLLTDEMRPTTWWEADVVLVMAIASVEMTDAHPVAAMRLAVELGWDTDSTAQVVGAFVGAMWGERVFPEALAGPVREGVQRATGDTIEAWVREIILAR